MHRRVVSTHSRSSSLPIFLTLVLTFRTFRTVTMCTSFSECSAFSVRKSTWVTAFVCHFPNEKFSRFLSGVFQFYLRLVRRKNWFLNCNSVKVRFVFNSLWIKFTGCVCAVFFSSVATKKQTPFVAIANNTYRMKWNLNQILWLVCEIAMKAQHLVPSWKFDLVKINHSVELFSFQDFRNSIVENLEIWSVWWCEEFFIEVLFAHFSIHFSIKLFLPPKFNWIAMCVCFTHHLRKSL